MRGAPPRLPAVLSHGARLRELCGVPFKRAPLPCRGLCPRDLATLQRSCPGSTALGVGSQHETVALVSVTGPPCLSLSFVDGASGWSLLSTSWAVVRIGI